MARDDREVIVVEREGGGTLKWLLLGAAVGAGLALLLAPQSGRELRRDLSKRIRNLREFADDTLDELKDELADEVGVHRSEAGGGDDEATEAEPGERGKPAAIGAREELERRLAAARARRRRAVPEDDEEPVA